MTVRDVKSINGLRTVSLINEILMELLKQLNKWQEKS